MIMMMEGLLQYKLLEKINCIVTEGYKTLDLSKKEEKSVFLHPDLKKL